MLWPWSTALKFVQWIIAVYGMLKGGFGSNIDMKLRREWMCVAELDDDGYVYNALRVHRTELFFPQGKILPVSSKLLLLFFYPEWLKKKKKKV